jgi:hypothetical protein
LKYKPTPLGSIHGASPYFHTPEPTEDRTYKPNTSPAAEVKTNIRKLHTYEAL